MINGTLLDAAAIVAGTLLGLLLKKGLPERVKSTVMQGLALAVILIGLQMALQAKNPLTVVISLVLGGITGGLVDIEKRLDRLGAYLERRMGGQDQGVAPAFVTASLIFCVGAMAVVGSIQEGLTGHYPILLAKTLLDGTGAVFFASTMGVGVMFAAVPVLLYQGTITVLAGLLRNLLSAPVIAAVSAVGGLLITGIGLNILGVRRIRVGNLLPALVFAALIAWACAHVALPFLSP